MSEHGHGASAEADQALVSDGAPTDRHPAGFDPSRDETRLLVSDADKPLTWDDLDDATLGRFARYFIIVANRVERDLADNSEWPMLTFRGMHGGIALCRLAHEAGARKGTWELDGAHDGLGLLGDWTVTAVRRDSDRSGEADETRSGSAVGESAGRNGIAQPVTSPTHTTKEEG